MEKGQGGEELYSPSVFNKFLEHSQDNIDSMLNMVVKNQGSGRLSAKKVNPSNTHNNLLRARMYYFAYGSNMNHKQMRQRCPSAKFLSRAKLIGYKFVYDGYSSSRKGAVANVIKSDKDVVWGGLYKIDDMCRERLDQCEGYPNQYQRKKIKVIGKDNNEYGALIYLREAQKEGNPSDEYRKTVLEGAEDCGLPQDYIDNYINR